MQERPIWKPIVIVAVIALCLYAWMGQGLKPGMDLAGGFVLVYDVQVPPDEDSGRAIEQIIQVLSKRVDPNGVRNLVWRQQGASRLEIQAALAPPEVRQYREQYLDAAAKLKAGNVTRGQLESILKKPDEQRGADFDRIAGDSEQRRKMLSDLALAHDTREKTRQPFIDAYEAAEAADKALKELPEDAPEDQKQQAQEHARKLRAESTEKIKLWNEAKELYEIAMQAVLDRNVDPVEVDRVLTLSNVEQTTDLGEAVVPRQEALERLKESHPSRADQIDAVARTWAAYEQVRGPLDDPEDLIALLRGSGVLEFRIAPAPSAELETYIEQLREKGPKAGGDLPYRWFELDSIEQFAETRAAQESLRADPRAYFAGRGMVAERHGGEIYILLSNRTGQRISPEEKNWKITGAYRSPDNTGLPAVSFSLNTVGAQLLGVMTQAHVDEPMAIVLDGRVMSAPNINEPIPSGSVQISGGSGGFSEEVQTYLVNTLNAGSLKAQLSDRPISIKFFNPQMGQDNLQAGFNAAISAVIAVAVFMAIYYFFAGMVANFALVANMVVILGIMSMLQAVFTLPGIAGMVLTIGMAVDANVLIFERIREELDRGADAKAAVRLGYEKAFSTIVDANITTLITCLVLGYFATVEVKGFAVTLGIGICASMFTALFCTRVIVNYYVAWFNPKSFRMLPNVWPALGRLLSPSIDWIAKRKIVAAISIVAMAVSLVIVISRGREMMDIEFRAGTQVTFKLKAGATLELPEARKRMDETADALAKEHPEQDYRWMLSTAASIVAVGDQQNEFSIAVLNEDSQEVSESVTRAFEDLLTKKRPVHFEGQPDLTDAAQAPLPPYVYKVTRNTLGDNLTGLSPTESAQFIDAAMQSDVSPYFGGVAIVLRDLDPPASAADVTERIRRMRSQPRWENLGNREFRVIGLRPGTARAGSTEPVFQTVAVVSTDNSTNYDADDSQFRAAGGLAHTEWELVSAALLSDTAFDSVQNFSSQVSGTMQRQAITAMFLSLLAVVAYIWLRFGSLRYGLAAIAALVHDVTIALGAIALSHYVYTAMGGFLGVYDFKIDLAMVAALLTIVGYSLNDTIVIFDRIRENRGRLAEATPAIINDSINQTISRTALTSGTTFLAVLTLYMFGGAGVHGFAFCMIIGVVVGTYSSIAVAANLLLVGRKSGEAVKAAAPATV